MVTSKSQHHRPHEQQPDKKRKRQQTCAAQPTLGGEGNGGGDSSSSSGGGGGGGGGSSSGAKRIKLRRGQPLEERSILKKVLDGLMRGRIKARALKKVVDFIKEAAEAAARQAAVAAKAAAPQATQQGQTTSATAVAAKAAAPQAAVAAKAAAPQAAVAAAAAAASEVALTTTALPADLQGVTMPSEECLRKIVGAVNGNQLLQNLLARSPANLKGKLERLKTQVQETEIDVEAARGALAESHAKKQTRGSQHLNRPFQRSAVGSEPQAVVVGTFPTTTVMKQGTPTGEDGSTEALSYVGNATVGVTALLEGVTPDGLSGITFRTNLMPTTVARYDDLPDATDFAAFADCAIADMEAALQAGLCLIHAISPKVRPVVETALSNHNGGQEVERQTLYSGFGASVELYTLTSGAVVLVTYPIEHTSHVLWCAMKPVTRLHVLAGLACSFALRAAITGGRPPLIDTLQQMIGAVKYKLWYSSGA